MEIQLSIWDHNPERGYHFRQESGIPEWDEIVRKENNAVRVIDDDRLPQRIRVCPLSINEVVILVSKIIFSDGRPGVKTSSLLLRDMNRPIRWKKGILETVFKGLETSSNGGQLNIDIDTSLLDEHLFKILPHDSANQNVTFEGLNLDAVMTLWSALPPDRRSVTEVIVGDVGESEELEAHLTTRWHVIQDQDFRHPGDYLGREVNILQDIAGFETFEKSCEIADTTGLAGSLWFKVVESEMKRRDIPLSSNDTLFIRLHLSKNDLQIARRPTWREHALNELIGYPRGLAGLFFSEGGLLSQSEMMMLPEDQQLACLMPAIDACKFGTDKERSEILPHLITYASVFSSQVWIDTFQVIQNNLDEWLRSDYGFMKLFDVLLPKNIGLIHDLLRYSVKNSDVLAVRVVNCLVKHRILVETNEFAYILDDLELAQNHGDEDGTSVQLHREIGTVFSLQWSNLDATVNTLFKAHVSHEVSFSSIVESFEKWMGSDPHRRMIFMIYFQHLTAHYQNRPSRSVSAPFAITLAKYSQPDGFWFQRVFKLASAKQIRTFLKDQNLRLSDVPSSTLTRLHGMSPRLKGWPSPFRRVPTKSKPSAMARLSIQPGIAGYAHRFVGYFSCIVTSMLIGFLLVIALNLVGVTNVNLTLPDEIVILGREFSIPSYSLIVLLLVSSVFSFLFYRYRKNIRYLRRPING